MQTNFKMKFFPWTRCGALFISLLAGALLASCSRADEPKTGVTRVEAETKLAAGDAKLLDVAGASGGQAVSIARDWQPLLIAPIPDKGEAFTIWVRYGSKPVLVKADLPDGQKDLGWIWDSPARTDVEARRSLEARGKSARIWS